MKQFAMSLIGSPGRNLTRFVLSLVVSIWAGVAQAQLGPREGIVSAASLPPAQIGAGLVRLDVPHIRQKPYLCVPTSAAMVLRYFGRSADPQVLKAKAEQRKPASQRNTTFTYWDDMQVALRERGERWTIRQYPRSAAGFRRGLNDIRRSLQKGQPVLIDVHLGEGHTFVVVGYNDAESVVYVRDPDIPSRQARRITYQSLQANWHNHRFGPTRGAFFSRK